MAKPENWEADEKQIEMKSFPGIEKYIQLHFDELFEKEIDTLSPLEKIEKRLSALEEKNETENWSVTNDSDFISGVSQK